MAESDIEIQLNGKPLGGNSELLITIDDIRDEDVYAMVHGEEMWPDVVIDPLEADEVG